jgi:hypothetical protein
MSQSVSPTGIAVEAIIQTGRAVQRLGAPAVPSKNKKAVLDQLWGEKLVWESGMTSVK